MDVVPNEQIKTSGKGSMGKKVGFFFLALTPPIACILLQLILGGIYTIVAAIIKIVPYQMANPDISTDVMMNVYMKAAMDAASGGVMFYHLLSIPIFGLWYYFGCGKPKLKKSIKNVTGKAIIASCIGGVVLCLLTNGMVGIEQYIIPRQVMQLQELMETVGMGNDILANIAAIILAPIGEELVCRGITLYYAKKAFPKFFMANILQALMFGVIHANLVQGLYAFVIGLFLGYMAERYKSILPCMLIHFVVNFSTTVWIDKAFGWLPDTFISYLILLIVTSAIMIGIIFWCEQKKPKAKEA